MPMTRAAAHTIRMYCRGGGHRLSTCRNRTCINTVAGDYNIAGNRLYGNSQCGGRRMGGMQSSDWATAFTATFIAITLSSTVYKSNNPSIMAYTSENEDNDNKEQAKVSLSPAAEPLFSSSLWNYVPFASGSNNGNQSRDTKTAEKEADANSWYRDIMDTIDSITNNSKSAQQSDSSTNDQSDSSGKETTTSYILWMTQAKNQLDNLAKEVKGMDWGFSNTESSAENDTKKAEKAKEKSWLQNQLLDRIEAAQGVLGERIDDARVSLIESVHGMLPNQLQKPWVYSSAGSLLDPNVHPELLQAATVHVGHDLCMQEQEFRKKRAERVRKAFAEYIGVSEASIDTRDIPVIAVAGSGGGFRAMVSTLGTYRAMYQAGLAQCVMYDAAVSGSSWVIGALHTYGNGDPYKVLDNIRVAMRESMFSRASLVSFITENDALAKQVFADIAARYLLATANLDIFNKPEKEKDKGKEEKDSSASAAAAITSGGVWEKVKEHGEQLADILLPKQLNSAIIGHEGREATNSTMPAKTFEELLQEAKNALGSKSAPPLSVVELYGALLFKHLIVQHTTNPGDGKLVMSLDPKWTTLSAQRVAADKGLMPMPIYTAVRHFIGSRDNISYTANNTTTLADDNGNNNDNQQQHHKYQWFEFSPYEVGSIDHGAWIPTWAFGRAMKDGKDEYRVGEIHFGSIMGTVASAFCASVKAMAMEIYIALPSSLRSSVMDPLMDRFEQNTATTHLIPPFTMYNPFYRTKEKQSQNKGMAELENESYLSLMDGGLENNLPFPPLLRSERDVDVIICLDSSADIEIMPWFARAENWARNHSVRRWPWGARPWKSDPLRPSRSETDLANRTLQSTRHASERNETMLKDGNMRCVIIDDPMAPVPEEMKDKDGTTSVDRPPISVIYLPLLPNPQFRNPEFNPEKADFCATFNDQWTEEQIDLLADLTSFNFNQESERIREAVRKAYERKKAYRLYTETEA